MRLLKRDKFRSIPALAWITLIAFLIRLAVVPFVYGEWMQPYFVAHWEQGNVARALLAGHGFGSPFLSDQPSAIMPPVYPLIVAVIFKIFGVHTVASILATLGLNCLFSALACVPLYRIARRSFGPRVALWTGWAWAFSPYGIYFSAEWAWSTHLLLLCLYWLLDLAQQMEQSPSLRLWAGFGLLAGFAGLTEPSILTVVSFLLVLAMVRLARQARPWLLQGALAALVLSATLAPWLVRDALVFHKFIPLRDSMGLELWLGNSGLSSYWVNSAHHPNHDAAELANYNAGELAYMAQKQQAAEGFIRTHRRWFVKMCARRALYLWTGYWSFDKHYLAGEPLDPPNVAVATTLTLLGLTGLGMALRRRALRKEALRYAGVLLLLPMMYYFAHPEPYHMRPLDPLLAMLGCFAIVTWIEQRTARNKLPDERMPAARDLRSPPRNPNP